MTRKKILTALAASIFEFSSPFYIIKPYLQSKK